MLTTGRNRLDLGQSRYKILRVHGNIEQSAMQSAKSRDIDRAHLKGANMPRKKIKRRAWSKVDVKTFKMLARQKTPAAKIARQFKRTVGAIRQKALNLGVSLNSRA